MGYLLTTINRIWETTLSAIGSHLTLGLGGILFLGFPVGFWMGAYGYAIVAKSDASIGAAIATGIALAVIIGLLFSYFYARLSNDSFAVLTLAAVLAADALIRSWDALTGGVLGIGGVPRFIPGEGLAHLLLIQTIIAVVALCAETMLLHSPFGRSLRALKEHKHALMSLGTSPARAAATTIILGCALSGIAGIFAAARVQFLDPSLGGMVLLIQILTIAIVARTPRVLNLLTVTLLIVLLPEVFRVLDLPALVLGHIRNILYALMLMGLLLFITHSSPVKRYA